MCSEQLLKARHTVIETKISKQDILIIHSQAIFIHTVPECPASLLSLIVVLRSGKIPHLLRTVFLYHMPSHVIHGIIIVYTHKMQTVKSSLEAYSRNSALPYPVQQFRRDFRIFDIVDRYYDPIKVCQLRQIIYIVFSIAVTVVPVPIAVAVEYVQIHISPGFLYLLHKSQRPGVGEIPLPAIHEQCYFFHTLPPDQSEQPVLSPICKFAKYIKRAHLYILYTDPPNQNISKCIKNMYFTIRNHGDGGDRHLRPHNSLKWIVAVQRLVITYSLKCRQSMSVIIKKCLICPFISAWSRLLYI